MRQRDPVDEAQWMRVSEFVAERMGLHFPRERLTDLQRGVARAAKDLGFDDPADCAARLLTAPLTKAQLQVLAGQLTVGETYFLREPQTFAVLSDHVLPELIRARAGRDQRLRFWSAACASGEEAYSLAIVLRQILPDPGAWHVTILATDINARFLRKAVAGEYGEWSFRGVPSGFKERYFTRTVDGRYAVRPEIRRMVTFEHLNLADDVYPSVVTDTNAMDVVVCRNVLMYFAPDQMRKVVAKISNALVPRGWLVVSPGETSQSLFPQFATVSFPGVIVYRKRPETASWPPAPAAALHPPLPAVPAPAPVVLLPTSEPEPMRPPVPPPASYAAAASLYEQGRYGDAVDALLPLSAGRRPDRNVLSVLVRALANQGRLVEALDWCDRWIAAHKLDTVAHYLRAVVLMESGRPDDARRSLQHAVYLDGDFVLAHFALGNLARTRGRQHEAHKHYDNTLRILDRIPPDDVLPESDGLTAARLKDTITALTPAGADGGESLSVRDRG